MSVPKRRSPPVERESEPAEVVWEGDSLDMATIGKGTWELRDQDRTGWYRVVFVARIQGRVYVLHSFKKASRRTERRDIDVATERLSRVNRRISQGKI